MRSRIAFVAGEDLVEPGGVHVVERRGWLERRRALRRVAHRADGPAIAAAGALGGIHTARPLADLGHEMARFAFQRGDVGHRQHVDVVVPHALDQFRRDDAGGAVAGGERLVQAGHAAADRRALLHQIDAEPGGRKIQRRLNAGDAAPAHQHRPARRFSIAVAVGIIRRTDIPSSRRLRVGRDCPTY